MKNQTHAKKTIRVPIAVPESSAAESTSATRRKERRGEASFDQQSRSTTEGQQLTVVFCPPIESPFPDNKVKYKPNERPGYIIHCGCWGYCACARQHHRDAE